MMTQLCTTYVVTILCVGALVGHFPASEGQFLPEIRFIVSYLDRLNTLCPATGRDAAGTGTRTGTGSPGIPPKSCECDLGQRRIRPPFNFLTLFTCSPGFCRCPGPGNLEVDSRPEELRKLLSLCPRGQMESCQCADGSVAKFPFDLQSVFFECRPRKCKCRNSPTARLLTNFGCAKGGLAFCSDKRDFSCNDGSITVTRGMVLEAKLDRKCVCPDGKAPKCKKTGQLPTCPGGELIDLKVGDPGPTYTNCQL